MTEEKEGFKKMSSERLAECLVAAEMQNSEDPYDLTEAIIEEIKAELRRRFL